MRRLLLIGALCIGSSQFLRGQTQVGGDLAGVSQNTSVITSGLGNSVMVLTPLTAGTHWTDKLVTAYESAACANGCTIEIPDSVADDGSATTPTIPNNVNLKFTGSGNFIVCTINAGAYGDYDLGNATLTLSGSNCTAIRQTHAVTMQTSQKWILHGGQIDCNSQVGGTGVFVGNHTTTAIRDVNFYRCLDTTSTAAVPTAGLVLFGAQFDLFDNLKFYDNYVGVKLYGLSAAGGGQSNHFNNLTVVGAGNSTTPVCVLLYEQGSTYSMGPNYFTNFTPQSCSVAGLGIIGSPAYQSITYINGGAPELNGGGAASVVIDGVTIKQASAYQNHGFLYWTNVQVAEAKINPIVFSENNSQAIFTNPVGGTGSETFSQTDGTSASYVYGKSNTGRAIFQNVGAASPTLLSNAIGGVVSLFDFIPSDDIAAIQACTSTVDVSGYIQAAIDAVRTGGRTSRHLYAPRGCYAVGRTLAFGTSTNSMKSFIFEGEGTYDNYASAATVFRWIGAANGTIMQVTAVQNATFRHFMLDGNGHSPGIGLLDTTLNTAGANHQNAFEDIAVADIPGIPGRAISIDGNALAINQDVSSSTWSNIHVYPGISSSVVVGVYQAGAQTVDHHWIGRSAITGFSSRGMDFEGGDVRVDSVSTSGPRTGANVDDFYIAPGADWVSIRDTYTEVNASDNPHTRHAFNFPSGRRNFPTLISGSRVKWAISSGNPIYSAQTGGPFTLEGVSVDGLINGTATLFFENSGSTAAAANSTVHLFGNNLSAGINYYVSGNLDIPTSPLDRSTKTYVEYFPCTSLASEQIGTNGWYLRTIGVAASASCATNGIADSGIKLTSPSGGADAGHGGILVLDGASGTALFAPSGTSLPSGGNPVYDQEYRFQLGQTTNTGFRVGMIAPGQRTAVPTSGFYLRYDTSIPDKNFMICNDLAGVETCFDTGTVADTIAHTVRFRQTGNSTIGVTLYSAGGAVEQISGVDEATVCASGCTFSATPTTTGAAPAMSVVTNANSTAVAGYLLGWRAAFFGLTQ